MPDLLINTMGGQPLSNKMVELGEGAAGCWFFLCLRFSLKPYMRLRQNHYLFICGKDKYNN